MRRFRLDVNHMQTMHSKQSKREFRAPPGYGGLKETHQVEPQSEQGLEGGTLFVHEYERGGKVANLVLRGAGQTMQYAFVWQVENGRMSAQGSQLLFQTRPNRKKGEGWETEEFLARRVDIYRGKQGLFAITPVGLVSLQEAKPVREPNARGGFNADAFKAALAKDRQAFEARKAARGQASPAKSADDELLRMALVAVEAQGTKGGHWDAITDALVIAGVKREAAEAALEHLVRAQKCEQPTLTTIRLRTTPATPATAEDDAESDGAEMDDDGHADPGAHEEHDASGAEAA